MTPLYSPSAALVLNSKPFGTAARKYMNWKKWIDSSKEVWKKKINTVYIYIYIYIYINHSFHKIWSSTTFFICENRKCFMSSKSAYSTMISDFWRILWYWRLKYWLLKIHLGITGINYTLKYNVTLSVKTQLKQFFCDLLFSTKASSFISKRTFCENVTFISFLLTE